MSTTETRIRRELGPAAWGWVRENAAVAGLAVAILSAGVGGAVTVHRAFELAEEGLEVANQTRELLLGTGGTAGLAEQVRSHAVVIGQREEVVRLVRDHDRRIADLESGRAIRDNAVTELRSEIVRRLDRIDGQNVAILERLSRLEAVKDR